MELSRALSRIRRRLRTARALTGAARGLVIGAACALVFVYVTRLYDQSLSLVGLLVAALVPAVLGGLIAMLGKLPDLELAQLADRALGLHDRLTSALDFAALQHKSDLMLAAIADGERVAKTVDARRVVEIRYPRLVSNAAIIGVCAALVAFLRFPSPTVAALPVPPAPAKFVVDAETLAPEKAAAERFVDEAKKIDDAELKQLTGDLNKLVEELADGKLTRQAAFEKLAAVERKIGAPSDKELAAVKDALQKTGEEMQRSKLLREAGKALAEEDLDKAKDELKKLAEEAEKREAERKVAEEKNDDGEERKLKKQQDQMREELEQNLDKASRELQKQIDKMEQEEKQKLKDEERKLKKQLEKDPQNEELQRKLQKNQRELERLEREQQEKSEMQRQLQRLQRDMNETAEQMRKKMSPEKMKQMAEQMQQMQQQLQKMGQLQKVQVYVGELKEVMRRGGQGQPGQNGQPQNGQGQDGQGDGKGKGKGSAMDDFNARAGDGDKNKVLIVDPSKPGNGPTVLMPGMGPGQGQGQPGGGKDKGNDPGGGKPPGDQPGGDGIGDQHDPNVLGKSQAGTNKANATRVVGQAGAGPSRSETISSAAQKGFASKSYSRVYSDYSSIAEETMTKEQVPSGYRYYVKRYFQLIKPRGEP